MKSLKGKQISMETLQYVATYAMCSNVTPQTIITLTISQNIKNTKFRHQIPIHMLHIQISNK